MIQRIQSIFLALAALCTFGLFATDVAETTGPVPSSQVFADAHLTVFDSPLLIGGVAAVGLLTVVAIFLFGNRRLQRTLCTVAVILTLAYAAYGAMLWYNDSASTEAEAEPGVALPLLTIVFAALAARYITKDEKLVRSADRLR
ncbi:DUF4293 domain-containing protein [Lewinella sp. JB7]|uniref:DUF4293 domain-containing protein n=1 Tax=Lewinella sp. JB7 TaxID=2962887 RepID=UPI0020C95617|nr:DUF4293 domain-containing protein [Lewinella sp. JB7]MCP9235684.1 DUF4293 domain-containing protein [Lewinella sp. JB7]